MDVGLAHHRHRYFLKHAIDHTNMEVHMSVQAGAEPVDNRHGADVLVMGCAGMARFRDDLAAQTGLPVVEPTLAATGMAMSRVLAG